MIIGNNQVAMLMVENVCVLLANKWELVLESGSNNGHKFHDFFLIRKMCADLFLVHDITAALTLVKLMCPLLNCLSSG